MFQTTFSTLFNSQSLYRIFLPVLLILQLILFVRAAYQYPADEDEMWFAEESYFFAKDGYPHSEFFRGFYEREERVMVFHRLLVYTEGVFSKVFGWSLLSIRLISYLSALLILLVLFGITQSWFGKKAALWAVTFFFLIYQNFHAAMITRPEMYLCLWSILSFYFTISFCKKSSSAHLFFSGLFAGLALYTHLNGIVIIGATGVLLIYHKKIMPTIFFGLITLAVVSPYVFDVMQHFHLFSYQLSGPNYGSKTKLTLFSMFSNLVLNEQKRFFWKANTAALTLVLVVLLTVKWHSLFKTEGIKKDQNQTILNVMLYLIFSMVFMGLMVNDKRPHYAVMIYPIYCVIIGYALSSPFSGSVHFKLKKSIISVVIVFFIATGLYKQMTDAFFTKKERLSVLNAAAGKYLPDNAHCVAPMNFIFNEIHRLRISSLLLANFETDGKAIFKDEKITVESLARFCDKYSLPYAIQTKYQHLHDKIHPCSDSLLQTYFEIIVRNNDFTILKRRLPSNLLIVSSLKL